MPVLFYFFFIFHFSYVLFLLLLILIIANPLGLSMKPFETGELGRPGVASLCWLYPSVQSV